MTESTVRPAVYDRRQREFWVVGSLLLLLPPLFTQGIYGLGVLRLVLIYCLVALGYWVQFAVGGNFSLATAVFYANGAYLSAWGASRGGFPVAFALAVFGTGLLGAAVKRWERPPTFGREAQIDLLVALQLIGAEQRGHNILFPAHTILRWLSETERE